MTSFWTSALFWNAVAGAMAAAIAAGAAGFFLSLRALAFTGEALTDIGFAGASGAALAGVNPLAGMAGFSLLAVLGLGSLNDRLKGRDIETGIVLSFALGLGVLFLNLSTQSGASHASWGLGLLFGSLASITTGSVILAGVFCVVSLTVLALLFRPLLFASMDPILAQSRGVPVKALALGFLLILALAASVTLLVVGALLTSALLIAPATAALNFFRRPYQALAASLLFAVGIAWVGLAAAFFVPMGHIPASFFMAILSAGLYFASLPARSQRRRDTVRCQHSREVTPQE